MITEAIPEVLAVASFEARLNIISQILTLQKKISLAIRTKREGEGEHMSLCSELVE